MARIGALAIGLILVAAATALARAGEAVELKRSPTTMETRSFDPKHLPKPAPPIQPPEAACCVWDFDCNIDLDYTLGEQGPIAGLGPVQAKITGVRATLGLKVVIWLPKGASAELKAHEEGHRAIAQRVYDKSEPAVKKLLQSHIGKTFDGDNAETAGGAAEAAGAALAKACINLMGDQAGPVSAMYDEITNHSLKKDPPAEKAVELAFERVGKEGQGKR